MNGDRPFLGILMMLGFCVLIPFGDAIAKMLGASVPLILLVITRFGFQAVLLTPMVWLTRGNLRMSPYVLKLTALRSALQIMGISLMFLSLRALPLADAIAIAFVMPFIMLLLGHFVLGEEVGMRRFSACVVGFIGTLMVIQPSFSEVGWIATLPLLVALIFSLFMLVTRHIAKEAGPLALQAVGGLMGLPVLLLILVLPLGVEDLSMRVPAPGDLWLLAAMGVFGTAAHLMMTWSLRFAPSTTLAPMQYLEIPMATILGWVFFRDLPDGLAAAGIALTIGAGLFIIWREQVSSRVANTVSAAPPMDP